MYFDIATVSAVIALASAAAAWGAVFANRQNTKDTIVSQTNIAARTARATVVSANRQKWIDALRDDLSDYMASTQQIKDLAKHGSFDQAGQDALHAEHRTLTQNLSRLRIRIELRLNPSENRHLKLLKLIDDFRHHPSAENDQALRAHATTVFKEEWGRLQKEAAGIDPLVKPLKLS